MKSVEDIITMIGNTSGSRFHCSRRLKAKDRFYNGVIFFASSIAILASIAPALVVVDEIVKTYLTLTSISLSVIILALSGIQYGSNFAVQSELMHKCALEINEVRRVLESTQNPTEKFVKKCLSEYDLILQRYPMNHETVDFLTYKLEHHWRFPELNHTIVPSGTSQCLVTANQAFLNRSMLRGSILWLKHSGLIGTLVLIALLILTANELIK
jgi:SMODS and SLOG-associating 2TM effector domain family 5